MKQIQKKKTLELSEYTAEYCSLLEMGYGKDMMSEGGASGIEHMFQGIPLNGKIALDIGSGLGGVAFYLADQYAMKITGLEVNPWMVHEATCRIPSHLKDDVSFVLSESNSCWPFNSEHFDIIYSKSVLTHVRDKLPLFKECFRLLKPYGYLIITDWLTLSTTPQWGPYISKLIELENLSLYPTTEEDYRSALSKNGFQCIISRNDSPVYQVYNLAILDRLKRDQDSFLLTESEKETIQASIMGHEMVVSAIEKGELRVMQFVIRKNICY